MEAFELLCTIGEGTYGVVLKAKHRESGQVVAIKKFKESDEDEQVRKTALREVRILKQLRHENVVSLIEVFRRKRKLYLVFEYVESTLLEELERHQEGLEPVDVKRIMWQLVRGVEHLHSHNVIHRDLKPENLLLSKHGVLKLCDFGFARTLAGPGARYTDYVSTRWYRCPELLIGDTAYGKAVDTWALGCLMAEISNGMPLFPGDSDVDQLFQIMKVGGPLPSRSMDLLKRNPLFNGARVPDVPNPEPLEKRLPTLDPMAVDVIKQCLRYDPLQRISAADLLRHPYFSGLEESFGATYRIAVEKDSQANVLGRRAAQGGSTAAPVPVTVAVPVPTPAPVQPPAQAKVAPIVAASPAKLAAAAHVAKLPHPTPLAAPDASLVHIAGTPSTTQPLNRGPPLYGNATSQPPASSPFQAVSQQTASQLAHAAAVVSKAKSPAIPQYPADRVRGRGESDGVVPSGFRASDAKSDSNTHDEKDRDRASERGAEVDDASSHADGMSQLSSRIAAMAANNTRRDRPMNSGKGTQGQSMATGQPGFGANAGPLGMPGLNQALQRAGAGAWPADVQRSVDVQGAEGAPKHPSISPLGSRSNSPGHGSGFPHVARHLGHDMETASGSSGATPATFSPTQYGGSSQAVHAGPSHVAGRQAQGFGQGYTTSSSISQQYVPAMPVGQASKERKEKEGEETVPSAALSNGASYGYGYGYPNLAAGVGATAAGPAARRSTMDPFGRAPAATTMSSPGAPMRRFQSEGKNEEDEPEVHVSGVGGHTVRITVQAPVQDAWSSGTQSMGVGRAAPQVGQSVTRRDPAPPAMPSGLNGGSIEDTLASMGLGMGMTAGKVNAQPAARAGLGTRGREREREGRGEAKERDNSKDRDRSPAPTQLSQPGAPGRLGGVNGVLGPSAPGLPNTLGGLTDPYGKDPGHGGVSMLYSGSSMQMPFVIGTGSPNGTLGVMSSDEDRENRVYGGQAGLYGEDSLYASLRSEMASRARDREVAQGRERERVERRRQEMAQTQPPPKDMDRRGLPSREGGNRSTLHSRGAGVMGMSLGAAGTLANSSGYASQGAGRAGYADPSFTITGMAATPLTSHGKQQPVYVPPAATAAAMSRASYAAGPSGAPLSGLSVTAIRRDAPARSQDRPSVASSHGMPTGLSQGSIVLGQGGGRGAGGSYALSYGTGYRSTYAGGGAAAAGGSHQQSGLRSSLGLPMGLQGAATGSMRYPAGVGGMGNMPGMGMGISVGVGGMRAAPGLGGIAGHTYGLQGLGMSLRGNGR